MPGATRTRMRIGYARVSTEDQNLRLQIDALRAAGCARIYRDKGISALAKERPGLTRALAALRRDDVLVVWKLDRLGRSLLHLTETIAGLRDAGIGFQSLQEQIDTTSACGRFTFHMLAALAEFERELIAERTIAGLASARARGRKGGRPFKMTAAKLRLAMAAMGQPETKVGDLCQELGITRQTLYRHISPKGELRPDGTKLLNRI